MAGSSSGGSGSGLGALEAVLSVIVGALAAVGIGIFFAVKAVFGIFAYGAFKLAGLIAPKLKPRLELKRMCRKIPDKGILRLGLFRKVELNGGAMQKIFQDYLRQQETYRAQVAKRSSVADRSVLQSLFDKTDGLYREFERQFYLAAKHVGEKSADIYSQAQNPAVQQMDHALKQTARLLAAHDTMLTRALQQDADAANIAAQTDLEYLETFNETQQSSMQ